MNLCYHAIQSIDLLLHAMTKPLNKDQDHNIARNNLMRAALRLFVAKGYEGASTREICDAAAVNLSAIRYYFNDKAGLYRAVFTEPLEIMQAFNNKHSYRHLPLDQALDGFFRDFLAPFTMSEDINLVMKLHFREMVEPTGAWQETIEAEIKPLHQALVDVLLEHLRLPKIDLDIQRLAFSIIGMGVHLFVGQDVVTAISPELLNSEQAIALMAKRLSAYAQAMIRYEAERRAQEKTYANF